MTAILERPTTETAITPDERRGVRILPTWEEQHVIDLYAEGFEHSAIAVMTGWTYQRQVHLLAGRCIPLRLVPAHPDRPRSLTPAEIVAGDSGWLERCTAAQIASVESGGWLDRRIAALNAANARDMAQR